MFCQYQTRGALPFSSSLICVAEEIGLLSFEYSIRKYCVKVCKVWPSSSCDQCSTDQLVRAISQSHLCILNILSLIRQLKIASTDCSWSAWNALEYPTMSIVCPNLKYSQSIAIHSLHYNDFDRFRILPEWHHHSTWGLVSQFCFRPNNGLLS